MAIGRRCGVGCETWPDEKDYEICLICGQPTRRYRGVQVIEQSALDHYLFEQFYKEWDKRPAVRLQMTPEESLKWDQLYPDGRPREPTDKDS
jgi:hypothetical protein